MAEETFEDAPYELRSTAGEWYDGGDSAMYRFWWSKPVDPVKLEKEVAACVAQNTLPEWTGRLAALHGFAAAEARKAKAVRKVEAAAAACIAAGVERWKVEKAVEAACSAEQAPPAPGR